MGGVGGPCMCRPPLGHHFLPSGLCVKDPPWGSRRSSSFMMLSAGKVVQHQAAVQGLAAAPNLLWLAAAACAEADSMQGSWSASGMLSAYVAAHSSLNTTCGLPA